MTASTTTTAPATPETSSMSRRKVRLLGVAGTITAALLLWAVAELLGMDVMAPGFQGQPPQDIRAGNVAFSSAVASLAGWGLLALLERLTRRARPIWTLAVVVGFLLSLGAPLSGEGIGAGNRMVLLLLHAVVAGAVIAVGRRTSSDARQR